MLRMGKAAVRFDYEATVNRRPLSDRQRMGDLVGRSIAMRTIYALIERSAASDVTVLLEGETGTGKSVVAYEIHRHGARAEAPFVTVDCGAVPANLL